LSFFVVKNAKSKKTLIEKHRKNPNTGKRRCNPPQEVESEEERKVLHDGFLNTACSS